MATKNPQGSDRTFQFSDPAAITGILVVVLLGAWAAWYFAHTQISALYVYVRYAELWLVNLLGSFVDIPIVSGITQWVQRMCSPASAVLLCTRDFSTVRYSDINNSTIVINGLLLLPLLAFCVAMFRHVNAEHPSFKYQKNHSIRSFAVENAELYPHLNLFTELDLVSKSLTDPRFGMSLTSRQFAYRHRLISGWQKMADEQFVPVLNREAANAVMLSQLGRHWTRSADLTPGETLLLAIVLPRVAATDALMNNDAFAQALADSDGLIKWCWGHFNGLKASKTAKGSARTGGDEYAWLRPHFDLSRPKEIIAKYINHPVVVDIISRHAYRRTILYAFYSRATALGVFPPADVRWMRFYDRELWYLRSSIGRQVAFAEGGSAVYSHYLYEVKAGYAIVEPQLDKAVNGLEAAMLAFKYVKADVRAYDAKA